MSETYYSTFSINSDESNLIRVFDDDNSGAMDFAEYMLAINATNLNTPQACFVKLCSILTLSPITICTQEKLNWMFDVFDQDGGGSISVNEIQDLLRLKYSI